MLHFLKRTQYITYTLLFSVFAFLPFALIAQTPISPNTWTGQGTSAPGPSIFTVLPASTVPGSAIVNISQWDRASSLTNTTAGGCYNSSNWQIGGSFAAAQAASKYIYFTITNDAATELRVTQLFIMSQVSATGPQNIQMAYSIDGGPDVLFGPAIGTAHTASPENWTLTDNMCVAPSQTATFKLYGWGGTGSAGTLRINNGTSITAAFAPGITAISATNSSPVCAGNPFTLTGDFTGGVPGYTFSWSGPAGYSSALLSPTIASPTAAASGVYTFTVTDALTCTASSVSAVTTATVTAAPPPSTGASTVCEGQTTLFSNTAAGGSWSTSDASIADVGATSGIVSGISVGTATITYSIGTSCIDLKVVTVNASPLPITGTAVVCAGFTTPLNDATAGGTWTSGDVTIADVNITTGVVTGLAPGTATISYTLLSGCYATTVVTVYAFPAAITGPDNVCSGATITLNDATAGGTWSSLNPSTASVNTSGVVTGGIAGNTTIVYTLPGGCSTSQAITVNPLPAAISGTAVVCVNASTILSDATFGGTWSSSLPPIANVSPTGTVTGVFAGTATISYTLSTGCYQTRVVTVNAIPNPITGPSGVCIGSSVTLNNSMAGGMWLSSNTSVATIGNTSGIVGSVSLGTTTITYRLTATGCFITRTETVNPLPGTISGAGTVCPGITITLTDFPAGGTWTSTPATIATVNATTGDVTGVAAGIASIVYTLPTGCSASTTVTVNPAPLSSISALGDTTMCPGDFVTLMANTGTGLTYQWFVAGGPIPGANTSLFTTGTAGAYQAEVTNTFGCSTLSVPMTVAVNAATATITIPGGSSSGCFTTGVLLNANTGTGLSYQWALGGVPIPGATNDVYTAFTPGNYTVIVSNTTGCSATSAISVISIFPSPSDAISLSGATTFCAGNHVTLLATPGSGYTYQWFNSGTPIPGATSNVYTANASGSYWAVVTNSFGCTTTSVATAVTTNPLPDVSIGAGGPKVFCTGGSVTLFSVPGGGFTYQWYKDGTAIAGATMNSYVATLTGGYRVRITNTTTGCIDTTHADTVVTNVNTPVIVPLTPLKFCWGGNSYLGTTVSSASSGINYQWFLNDAAIPGATTSTWHAGIAGTYKCVITIPGSCTVTTETVVVTQVPLPDPIIAYNGIMLSTAPYYTTYQWYKELAAMPGATAYSTLPTGNGNYKVFVTDTNGCQSASTTYVLTNWHGTPAGVNNTTTDNIRIYPNPAHDMLHIESAQHMRVVISGLDGKTITDRTNVTDIDISSMSNGVYIITFYDLNNQILQSDKFVKSAD